jgi:MoxR-like ATPase
MNITQEHADWFANAFSRLVENVERVIMGKREAVQLAFTCMLSDGHLLLEDVPGTGKTMLAKAMANTVDGSTSRIQFTPDLLPGDITGVEIYNQKTGAFDFHFGPIFATIVLADEINRASPKTQAALLEVMEEGKVSVSNATHPVGPPFMVIATQNPVEQAGTYRLPEAQLDRFLMKTSLGYPDHDTSVALLADASNRNRAAAIHAIITPEALVDMGAMAATVYVDPSVLSYVTRIAEATRHHQSTRLGVSMRGCLAYVRGVKTWAASQGRTFVRPDDVKSLAHAVLGHRLLLTPEAEFSGLTSDDIIDEILGQISPPSERGA